MHPLVVCQRGADTAWRTIVGETVVVHLRAKEFFGLNRTGADVWNALDGKTELGALAARFGIAPVDVVAFCAELRDLGLVEVVEEKKTRSEFSSKSEKPLSGGPQTGAVDPPRIAWREEMSRVAASCAFLPAQNPLCIQRPET